MMTEEDCDLLIKNNEKIRKLLEKGNANKYLTFKEINGAIDNMDTDVMDILFQLLAARKIVIVEDKREFESLSKNQNKIDDAAKFIHVEDKVGNNDDPIRLYLKEIGKVSLLTHDDEVDYSKKIESGESEIENIILNTHLVVGEVLNTIKNVQIGKVSIHEILEPPRIYNVSTQEKRKLERKYKANNRTGDWKKLKEGIHSDVDIEDSYKAYRDIKRNSEKRDAELDKKIEESPMMNGFEFASNGIKGIYNNIKGYFNSSSEPLRDPEVISDAEYKNRIVKVMDFAIKELGMTKEQAAGLAGNFMRESGMKTTAKNPGSPATGLAQWLGVRKKAFEHSGEFSEKEISAGWKYYDGPGSGKPLANASFEDQLRFVKWEMENIPAYKKGLEKIKSSKDHQEAAANVFGYYEFSAGPEGAVKNMIEHGQNGLDSLNKGINFAGDALLTYNSHKEIDNNKQSTSSNNSEIYTAQNISMPDNYVEQSPLSNSLSNYTAYDWNASSNNSFGSDALAEATRNISSSVNPSSVTPSSNISISEYTTDSTPSINTAKGLIANNDMTEIAKGISGKIGILNENIKVLQTGQLAQAESINNLSAAIGNIQINVNTGGQQKTPVQSATGIPYRIS